MAQRGNLEEPWVSCSRPSPQALHHNTLVSDQLIDFSGHFTNWHWHRSGTALPCPAVLCRLCPPYKSSGLATKLTFKCLSTIY